jgi:hypothetical protein
MPDNGAASPLNRDLLAAAPVIRTTAGAQPSATAEQECHIEV